MADALFILRENRLDATFENSSFLIQYLIAHKIP